MSLYSFFHPRKGGRTGGKPLKEYNRVICLKNNDCAVTDQILMRAIAIRFGSTLTSLCMSNCHALTNVIVKNLCIHLECLRYIDLSDCPKIGDAVGRTCADCCGKSILSIRLNGCRLISNEALLWISGRHGIKCTSLRSIDVSGDHNICSKGLEALGMSCRTLHHLNVACCTDVDDRGIFSIARGCKQLRSLNISNCKRVTDEGVSKICKRCKLLEYFNLANCKQVTDLSVHFISKLSRLKSLHLEGVNKLNEESMYELGKGCRNLIYLNLTGCSKITRCGLLALISGLGFVKEATDFFGFAPKDCLRAHSIGHYRRKAQEEGNLEFPTPYMKDSARDGCVKMFDEAAATIQWAFLASRQRRRYFYISSHKEQSYAAVLMVKCVRRWLELRRLPFRIALQKEKNEFVISVQRIVRGYLVRNADKVVRYAIHRLRERRIASLAALLLQCYIRQMLAKSKYQNLIIERRKRNTCAEIIQIFSQRVMLSMWCRRLTVNAIEESMEMSQASFCIGRLYRRRVCREKGKLLLLRLHTARKSAICIQSFTRRLQSHVFFRTLVEEYQMKASAALNIQRIFRGFYARINRLGFVASYVYHRQLAEHNSGITNAIRRYSFQDQKVEQQLQNDDHAYDELVGAHCQVFWPLNNSFITGQICGFNMQQNACKIIYADGDYEWLDLTNDSERLIIYK